MAAPNNEMPFETKPLSELEEIQLSMNQQTDEVRIDEESRPSWISVLDNS